MRSRFDAFSPHLAQQAGRQQAQRTPYRRERGAQFVAHRGDELIFHAVQRVTLADIAEAEHAAYGHVVLDHRGYRELHREGGAVFAVEDILPAGAFAHQEGAARAALIRTLFLPLALLMDHRVHGAADEIEGVGAQHIGCGWVDKDDPAGGVSAEDTVRHRVENRLFLPVQLFQATLLRRARHKLADGCANRFHRGHHFAIFALPLAAEELDYGDYPGCPPGRAHPNR